jgi:hypothetical protein
MIVSFGADNVTIERIHAGSLQTAGSKDTIIRDSEFGPCWAGNSFTGDPFTQTCGNFKLDGGWSGTAQERMVERILIEGNYFHDFQFGPSCFLTSAGGTHTGSPSNPDCHYECVFLNGGAAITFRGNVFRDCALMNIFTEDTQRYGYANLVIENNTFGTPISYGSPGRYTTASYSRADALAIGCKTTHPGYTGLLIRNNSFARNTTTDLAFSGCQTATGIVVSGNVMAKPACRAEVTYRYNVYNSGAGREHGRHDVPLLRARRSESRARRLRRRNRHRPAGRSRADRLLPGDGRARYRARGLDVRRRRLRAPVELTIRALPAPAHRRIMSVWPAGTSSCSWRTCPCRVTAGYGRRPEPSPGPGT